MNLLQSIWVKLVQMKLFLKKESSKCKYIITLKINKCLHQTKSNN